MAIDWKILLEMPIFAIDHQLIFGDIRSFLDFAEANIEPQKQMEIHALDAHMNELKIDEEYRGTYYDQKRESIEFRFGVVLPMRVRYAALISLIGTVEWSLKVLKPTFKMPKTPRGISETVHHLKEFSKLCGTPLPEAIDKLQFLIWIRNAITHQAGLLKGANQEAEIRAKIVEYPNFRISNWHHIGDTVEIERGALEPFIWAWSAIIRELHTVATTKKLIAFNA